MLRLEQLRAKLRLKEAELRIRQRQFYICAKALVKNQKDIQTIKERIKHEQYKLESVKQPVDSNDGRRIETDVGGRT